MGAGLATAAAFGAVWVNNRSRVISRNGPPALLDWEKARSIAHRMNVEPGATAEWHREWNTYYRNLVARAVPIIEEYTQTKLPRTLDTVSATSRSEWVDANISSFMELFEPIEKLNREAIKRSNAVSQAIMGGMNQVLVSGELGLLLGYMARRVLGQYDMSLLGKELLPTGKVYFVEPNIAGIINTLQVQGDEFRLWIALHESTHAFEFESHPWVRQHFNGILQRYFSNISDDLTKLSKQGGLNGLVQRVKQNNQPGSAWLERIMTPEQRKMFNELQALMSIIEGYSNHVMNAVGQTLMPSYDGIKQKVENRQKERSVVDRLFARLTGLNLKMEQYRLGEIFIDEVVKQKGIVFANQMWERPEYVPTLEEIKNPGLWIARLEQYQAATGV
jgi:coenzyme F420 biosynthesis associated uncharacterized protein